MRDEIERRGRSGRCYWLSLFPQGGSVIRMIRDVLTPERFQEGITVSRHTLLTHTYMYMYTAYMYIDICMCIYNVHVHACVLG